MNWLTDPFAYDFFARSLAAAALAGGVCGALGAFVVVRRMAYIAHGLSHAVIGGAAVATAISVDPLVGAGLWAFLTAITIERVSRFHGLHADTAIGVVTTASFAIGIAVISAGQRFERNLESFLFGGILGVDSADVVLSVVVAALVAAVLTLWYRPLLFASFDRDVAAAYGVAVARYEVLFALVLTAGVVASMRVLGVLLIAAAVVIPPAAARQLTDRFEVLLPVAAAIGVVTTIPGMYASWYLDIASGPAIVLAQTLALASTGAWRAARGPAAPAAA